jgi:hypothetical protein
LRSYPNIHALAWQGPDDLLVAHDVDSVDVLGIESESRLSSIRPRVGGWRTTYRLLIRPLAKIAPQPGRLGETVSAIILGDNRMTMGDRNLTPETIELRPWQALFNCLAFTTVMLFACCVYFQRLDL